MWRSGHGSASRSWLVSAGEIPHPLEKVFEMWYSRGWVLGIERNGQGEAGFVMVSTEETVPVSRVIDRVIPVLAQRGQAGLLIGPQMRCESQTAVPDPLPPGSWCTYCCRNCNTRLFSGSDPKKLPWNHNSPQDDSWYPIFTHHLKPCLIPLLTLQDGTFLWASITKLVGGGGSWPSWGSKRKSALHTSRWYWMTRKKKDPGEGESQKSDEWALEIPWAGLHLYHHHGGPGACGELVWRRSRAFVRFLHGSIHQWGLRVRSKNVT